MHRLVAGLGFAVLTVALLIGCDRMTSPNPPTAASPALSSAPVQAEQGNSAVIEWSCLTTSGAWQAANCPRRRQASARAVGATAAPNSPSNFAAAVSGSTVVLTWTAPTSGDAPTSYVIEAGSATGVTDLASLDTGNSALSLTVTAVPDGAYFVRVRAKNAAGLSIPSNEILLTVGAVNPCALGIGAPTNVAITVTGSSIRITWTAPVGSCAAGSYVIEAGSAAGLVNLANFNTGGTATSFSTDGVGAGTYFVRVRAVNANHTSAVSNEASFTIAPVCPAITAPSGLSISVSGTTVTARWNSVAGAISYLVEVGTFAGGTNVATQETTSTSYGATLAAGTYYFRVRSKNACGTTAPSSEVAGTVAQQCTAVGAPSGVAASVSSSIVTVRWNAVSGATSYIVEGGTSSGGTNTVTQETTATSYAITLANGTYYFRVRAKNSCSTSAASSEAVAVVAVTTTTNPTCNGASVPATVQCPNNGGIQAPTAKCNDATYSCSQNRSGTCSSHGGVSCYVCPGVICSS